MTPLLERCLDEAMKHYPRGCTYRIMPGQSWDAAAYEARRKEITPLVEAVLTIAATELQPTYPSVSLTSAGHFVNALPCVGEAPK